MENGTPPRVLLSDPNPPKGLLRIPPPARAKSMIPEGAVALATATSVIGYVPSGGTDLWAEPCNTFPESAKAAFDAAASLWAKLLQTPVPITILACWANFSGSALGYAGGGSEYRDFPGAPVAGTWFAESLANALSGSDQDSTKHDMHITFNGAFSFCYGIDGNTPPGQTDLMSVALHEIAHGLNFAGSLTYSGDAGSWGNGSGYPNIYDRFMQDEAGASLVDTGAYPNGGLRFHGGRSMAANGGQGAKIYAPTTWTNGASYVHLDYVTFGGTADQLMVYSIPAGVSIHDPGPVAAGICTVSASTVTGIAAGTCTIAADQAGNASYGAAMQVILGFSILSSSEIVPPSPPRRSSRSLRDAGAPLSVSFRRYSAATAK